MLLAECVKKCCKEVDEDHRDYLQEGRPGGRLAPVGREGYLDSPILLTRVRYSRLAHQAKKELALGRLAKSQLVECRLN